MFSFFNNDDIIWIGNGTNFTDKEIWNKIRTERKIYKICLEVKLWILCTDVFTAEQDKVLSSSVAL